MVPRLVAGHSRNRESIAGRVRDLFIEHIQSSSGTHVASCSVDTGVKHLEDKAHHSHPNSEALHIPLRHSQGQFNKNYCLSTCILIYSFCSAGINAKNRVFTKISSLVLCVYINGRDNITPQLDYGFSVFNSLNKNYVIIQDL
jgi:hypothetical protein